MAQQDQAASSTKPTTQQEECPQQKNDEEKIMEASSSSSTKPEPSETDLAQMKESMSNGKRHLVCNEPTLALDCFVELCEKLAYFYGQTADECAEGYLYYGKALLEMARAENGVLGNAVKDAPVLGVPDHQHEDEEGDNESGKESGGEVVTRAELRADVEYAMRGGNLYNDSLTEDEQTAEEGDEQPEASSTTQDEATKTDPTTDTTKETTAPSTTTTISSTAPSTTTTTSSTMETEASSSKPSSEPSTTTDAASSSGAANSDGQEEGDDAADDGGEEGGDDGGEDVNQEDEEEDVTNMQLSWEMFELCCLICNRIIKRKAKSGSYLAAANYGLEARSYLAAAKYGLAQISLESEHYEEAVTDFTTCLELYKQILADDKEDRKIAEVQYNIGLALSFDKKFDTALVHFNLAKGVLEARLKTLEDKVKEATEAAGKEKLPTEVAEWKKEISELTDLVLLDMKAKIEDATEMKKQGEESIESIKEVAKEMFNGMASGFDKGFETGFDSGFDKPSDGLKEVGAVNDIQCHQIRSAKRKTADDEEAPPTDMKKLKQTNGVSSTNDVTETNGVSTTTPNDVSTTNGHAQAMES